MRDSDGDGLSDEYEISIGFDFILSSSCNLYFSSKIPSIAVYSDERSRNKCMP